MRHRVGGMWRTLQSGLGFRSRREKEGRIPADPTATPTPADYSNNRPQGLWQSIEHPLTPTVESQQEATHSERPAIGLRRAPRQN